jgi:uncharacterized cupin superfamily protein
MSVLKPTPLVRAAERARLPEESYSHPLNPHSEVHGFSLSDAAGLSRVGVHLVRIPPGKESFVFHAHYGEEEFVYILSGRGIAEIGDEEHEVGPGDFMGFPTPSVGHHLRNPFAEDLVYLSGGERRAMEVADYPRLGKRMVRVGGAASLHAIEGAEGFAGHEPVRLP